MVFRSLSLSLCSIFGISVFLFAVSTWFDLSRYTNDSIFIFKYVSIVLVLASVLFIGKKGKADFYSMLGLSAFLLFLCFYTIINLIDLQDLIVLSGYILLYFLYFFLSKSKSNIQYYLKETLFFLGVLFVFLNVPFIFDSTAYSNVKAQFTGFFGNANAFTGLAGLFFILFFYFINVSNNNFKKLICLSFLIVLAFFLFLGFSRGALLSTAVACSYLLFKMGGKRVLLISFSSLVFVFLFYIFKFDFSEAGANRDFFEETGRRLIFDSYFHELSERYFFIGTGVSKEAGRIKSELAYLDIFLMTGLLGMVGFIVLIFRTLYMSVFLVSKDSLWLVSVYIYIVFSSVFEGYVANVLSLNSILFYIISALIYSCYRSERLMKHST